MNSSPVSASAFFASLAVYAVSPAVSAAPNPDWQCRRCPDTVGWVVDVEAGPASVSDDAYRFGDYTGLDEKGGYLFGDFSGQYQDSDANFVNFEGFTLSPDFGALFVEGGKQGLYHLRGSYQSIPRRFFDETVSPFSLTNDSLVNLPPAWVRAPTTSQMTALDDAAEPVTIKRDWDVIKLGFDITPNSRWRFSTDYARRERKGRDLSSASFLFNATEFAQPADYTTDDIKLTAGYGADTWQAEVTYVGSYFDNGNDLLEWDNPFTGLPGADSGQVALPPDNESHQLSMAGSLLLPARTTLNGQLAFGRMSQNEELLPYTTNPLISQPPLPIDSANAEADTLNFNLRATTSPARKVTLEGEFRYNEYDNRTSTNEYDYVVTDSFGSGIPVRNLSYGYKRSDLKLRAEYRASSRLKLFAGFDTGRFKRNFQERSRTDTDRLWLRLRSRIGSGANLDVDLFSENRTGSTYEVLTNPAAQQNPLMRKYNFSDRDRRGIKLRSTLLLGSHLDFGWELEYGNDDYDDSLIGVTESRYTRAGVDLSWLFDGGTSTYASLYTEDVDVEQTNSQTFSLPDWSATTNDTFTNATLGVVVPDIRDALDLELDYTWSHSVGRTRNNTSGLRTEFPDLDTRRQTLKFALRYDHTESWRFGLIFLFERLESSDWGLAGVGPATVPNLLSLGAQPFNYDVSVVYFSIRYRRHATR